MTTFPRRGWSPDTPCLEYAKFQQIAEELVANITETAASEDYEQAQKSLLFLFQELQEHIDPLHPRFPGGHRCLKEAFLRYTMLLRNRALFSKLNPPSAPPPEPRSLSDVVTDFAGMPDAASEAADTDNGE